jgi:hypothetical protein
LDQNACFVGLEKSMAGRCAHGREYCDECQFGQSKTELSEPLDPARRSKSIFPSLRAIDQIKVKLDYILIGVILALVIVGWMANR